MSFDLVIRGARVVDGSGLPAYIADVGIRGERIGRIGRITEPAPQEIDGTGLVLAPGFIDTPTTTSNSIGIRLPPPRRGTA